MKKIIYSAIAMAFAFFAASCQQEKFEPVATGNTVTYTVKVADALATKAIGDETTTVDKVYYQVYREAEVGNLTKVFVYEGEADVNAGTASFDLEFVKNQKFVVLFWAQDEDLQMFNIEDLRKVQLTTPGASNNVNAQVFAGSDTVTDCVSGKGGNVELTRPISQLNIFTTKESLKYGDKTIDLVSSTVTVKGIYTTYNVAAGDVVTTADPATANFTYSETTVPDTQDADPYVYVAMNYVGFAPAQSTTVDVEFTITTSEGDVPHSVSSVPVKPNYRTNIVGNLLTEAADYNVTLEAGWADEEYTKVVVSTSSALQTEVYNILDGETGEITLGGDIDFGDLIGALTRAASDPASLIIPANKTVVLDLNGYTLSQTAKQTGAHSMIVNNGNLTIVDNKGNGKISYSDTGNGGEYVSNTIVNNGRLVIESGVIENNSSATVASNGYPHPVDNNGELIINGGTLTNNANYASMRIWCTTDDNTSVTINGGTFNGSIDFQTPSAAANKGSLTINGGTFTADTYTKCAVRLLGFGADVDEMLGDINGGTFNGEIALKNWSGAEFNSQVFYITGGKFLVDPTAFVVDGYPVNAPETEGGYYTIGQFVPAAKIGETEYASLQEAAAAAKAGDTITVLRDATLSAELTLPANVTLNGNCKQINGTIYAGGNLTFVGHTKVTSFSASYYDRVITIGEGACLEITGTGRVTLGYGNTFNITGNVEDAKTADKSKVQPSLIIPAGISITGGSDATMNVTNAYVQIGSTSSKNNAANGVFTLNFTNSIAEFTDQLTFAEPTSGKNPTFNMNVTNSVLTTGTKLCVAAPNTNVVVDNSTVTLATYFRNSGKFQLKNGSVLTGSTIQFGENGGNNGALTVDASKVTITATTTGYALDGKGTGVIKATNDATVNVDYYKAMTITTDATSTFKGTEVK